MHLAEALFDPVVAPPGQFAVYNALPGPKELFVLTAGHFEHPGSAVEDRKLLSELRGFPAAMNREYHRWYSHRLGHDMELLVFGYAGAKVLVFPTRDGRFYEYEDLHIVDALRHKIDAGQLQLYCLDSIDWETFYCWWCYPPDRVRRHAAFEEYILNEVMLLMASKNSHPCTIAHGCSFGAFHAANIAFRHPHLFQKLAAFSGRYDPTLNVECFRDLLDGHRDEVLYCHTPVQYLRGADG